MGGEMTLDEMEARVVEAQGRALTREVMESESKQPLPSEKPLSETDIKLLQALMTQLPLKVTPVEKEFLFLGCLIAGALLHMMPFNEESEDGFRVLDRVIDRLAKSEVV
jgi:hypothetical protein